MMDPRNRGQAMLLQCFLMALLHNKVMNSLEESDVIDGPDAQTDPAEVSHYELARI